MMKRMLRTVLAMVLVLAMTVGLLPAMAEDSATALTVGTKLHGFTVMEEGELTLVNAKTVLLQHDKTGAQVLFLLNSDTNRTFNITFKTPVENDMGVPHIFEHSTLDGSEKYPSKSLFFNLSYQTYNTYMNAMTSDQMTTFPVSSLSEAQLLKYADYYLDSCFHPLVHQDEGIFLEEAWRYSLEDKSAPLTIAGTVYSEMQGSITIDSEASSNTMKTAFPGSRMGNVFGGDPAEIPNMTWQDLKDYHNKYYHPSNSLTTIYGDIADPAAFLQLLDGVFSPYEAKVFTFEHEGYTPVTAPVEKVCQYPVANGTDVTNGAVTQIVFIAEGATPEELDVLDLLTSLLSDSSSQLNSNLLSVLPAVSCSAYVDASSPEPCVVFTATGMNEADVPLLKASVLASLADFADEGVSAETLDAYASSLGMETRLMTESSDIGLNMIYNIAYMWASTGDLNGYQHFVDNLSNFGKFQEEGKYAEVIHKYLTEANQRVITVTTVPAPGLLEQEQAELAAKLAKIKAEMSAEEIDKIVADTAARAMPAADDASQYIAQLTAVTVDSLPEEVRQYESTDVTDEKGIRHIDVLANVDGVGQTYMLLDASGISQEDIHWLQLYVDTIGSVNTENYDISAISSLIGRYLYGVTVKVAVLCDDSADGYTPYLRASWNALDDDLPASYDALYEVLYRSEFTDTTSMLGAIAYARQNLQAHIEQESYLVQLYRALAINSPSYNFYNYATDLPYYQFLNEAEALLASDPAAYTAKLEAIQQQLCNASNAVFGFAGNADSIAANRAASDAFAAQLRLDPITAQTYDLPVPAEKEAIIIGGTVNYNMLYASWDQLGMEGYTGAMDAVCALVSDGLLYPYLRDQYGAYGVFHGADEDGVYIISYQDPNITQTFNVYNMLSSYVPQLGLMLTQDALNGYIMSCYSYYALSTGELTGAAAVIPDLIEGKNPYRRLEWMQELKALTVKDLAGYTALYQKLANVGYRSTSGSETAIQKMPKKTYSTIITP